VHTTDVYMAALAHNIVRLAKVPASSVAPSKDGFEEFFKKHFVDFPTDAWTSVYKKSWKSMPFNSKELRTALDRVIHDKRVVFPRCGEVIHLIESTKIRQAMTVGDSRSTSSMHSS
jgi:hypothetical protein